jgi:hypothetical protein
MYAYFSWQRNARTLGLDACEPAEIVPFAQQPRLLVGMTATMCLFAIYGSILSLAADTNLIKQWLAWSQPFTTWMKAIVPGVEQFTKPYDQEADFACVAAIKHLVASGWITLAGFFLWSLLDIFVVDRRSYDFLHAAVQFYKIATVTFTALVLVIGMGVFLFLGLPRPMHNPPAVVQGMLLAISFAGEVGMIFVTAAFLRLFANEVYARSTS